MSNECCSGKNDYIMGKNDLPSLLKPRMIQNEVRACSRALGDFVIVI